MTGIHFEDAEDGLEEYVQSLEVTQRAISNHLQDIRTIQNKKIRTGA